MAEIIYEDWTGLSLGSDPANLPAWDGSGTGTRTIVDAPTVGMDTRSVRFQTTGTYIQVTHVFAARSEVYLQFYWMFETDPLPAGNIYLAIFSGATGNGEIRINDGNFQIRNHFLEAARSSTTAVPGQWYRLEYSLNVGTSNQILRIFTGANLHSNTPNETINGNYTHGDLINLRIGPVAQPNSLIFDELISRVRLDDAEWAAPLAEPNVAPTVPNGLSLQNITDTEATFSWNASTDDTDSQNEIVYRVYIDGTLDSITAAGVTEANISVLTANTSYDLTVSAEDTQGAESAQSSVMRIHTPIASSGGGGDAGEEIFFWNGVEWRSVLEPYSGEPLAAPNNPVAKSGIEKITLTADTVADADSYRWYRSTTQGGPYPILVSDLPTPAYTDTNVSADTTYYYRVTAFSSEAGNSGFSVETSATPSAPIITTRFPGDPAPHFGEGTIYSGGTIWTLHSGVSNAADWIENETGYQLVLDRHYASGSAAWSTSAISTSVGKGRIPVNTCRFSDDLAGIIAGDYDIAIQDVADHCATLAPSPIWLGFLHEPEENVVSGVADGTSEQNFRAACRHIVATFKARQAAQGYSNNVAWTFPMYMDSWSFRGGYNSRGGAWKYDPDWKGTLSGFGTLPNGSSGPIPVASDWWTGDDAIVDIMGYDTYWPWIEGSAASLGTLAAVDGDGSNGAEFDVRRGRDQQDSWGRPRKPIVIGEWGGWDGSDEQFGYNGPLSEAQLQAVWEEHHAAAVETFVKHDVIGILAYTEGDMSYLPDGVDTYPVKLDALATHFFADDRVIHRNQLPTWGGTIENDMYSNTYGDIY